jgi:hypothetical protein
MKFGKSVLTGIAAAVLAVPIAALADAGTPRPSFIDHPEHYRSASPQQAVPASRGTASHASTVLPSFVDHPELYRAPTASRIAGASGAQGHAFTVLPSFVDHAELYRAPALPQAARARQGGEEGSVRFGELRRSPSR